MHPRSAVLRALFLAAAMLAVAPVLARSSEGVFFESAGEGWRVTGVSLPDGVVACAARTGEGAAARTLGAAVRAAPPGGSIFLLAPSGLPSVERTHAFHENASTRRLGEALAARVENGAVAVELSLAALTEMRRDADEGRTSSRFRLAHPSGGSEDVDVPLAGLSWAAAEQARCMEARPRGPSPPLGGG